MKYLLITFTMLSFTGCNKDCKNILGSRYEFQVSSTLYPALDTFNIGDTITIISEFSDQVYEAKTDRTYDLSNKTFLSIFLVSKISVYPTDYSAISSFKFILNPVNEFYYLNLQESGRKYLHGKYIYTGNQYSITYKIIPKDTGLFTFEQGPWMNHIEFPDKCDDMTSDFNNRLNKEDDNNINLLLDSPDEHFNTWILIKPDERFHSTSGYAFYVK